MLENTSIIFFLATIFMVAARSLPMDEEPAAAHLTAVIDEQCKLIQIDKTPLKELMNYFHIEEEIDAISACDLACDAFSTSKRELAEVILKSDGDLFYAVEGINSLFDTELLQLRNDIVTLNIYGVNSIGQKMVDYTVEHFAQENKVAAYMIKKLLDSENSTNYPALQERISRIQIPADEMLLTLFGRNKEISNKIFTEAPAANSDDEVTNIASKKQNNKYELANEKLAVQSSENVQTDTTTKTIHVPQLVDTVEDEASKEKEPRLIDLAINSEFPLVKLKEELVKSNQDKTTDRVDANTDRANKIDKDNDVLKDLYDVDNRDYVGIRNIGQSSLEQNVVSNIYVYANNDDYGKYQVNTSDMGNSVEAKEAEDKDGRNPSSSKSENKPQTKPESKPSDTDEAVQVQDFDVSEENAIFQINLIKKGLATVLKFVRNAAGRLLDQLDKMAVSSITKPDIWYENILNYPKYYVVLRVIDNIYHTKKMINSIVEPMIDSLEKKGDNSRGMNPFSAFTDAIKNNIQNVVQSVRNYLNFVRKIPFVGGMIALGENSTVQFFVGIINRINEF